MTKLTRNSTHDLCIRMSNGRDVTGKKAEDYGTQAMCGSLDRRTAALLVRPETAERGRAVRVGRRTIRLE